MNVKSVGECKPSLFSSPIFIVRFSSRQNFELWVSIQSVLYVLGVRSIWVCGDGISEWDILMRQFHSVFELEIAGVGTILT
jgi:hypothetical protein